MNIVVTIPKMLINDFERELKAMQVDHELRKLIKLPNLPSMADVDDAIFIVLDGKVRYKAIICGFGSIGFDCSVTDKHWGGIFVACRQFEEFHGPNVLGFQGFRYAWWEGE